MPGITVTKEVLEELSGTEITSARFSAIKSVVTSHIRSYYSGDDTIATGRAQNVLNAVFTSFALRMVTNPSGARSVGLGGANVTFGGSDESIANVGSLTNDERKALRSLAKPRQNFVRLTPYDNVTSLPDGYTYFNHGTDTGSLPGSENVTIIVQEGS